MMALPNRSLRQQPAGAPHRVRLKALWAGCVLMLSGAACAAQSPTASSARTLPAVVVWDFDNQSPRGLTAAADSAVSGDFLKRSLSESITAQLLQVPGLPVVERQRLKDLLAEQRVSASELADEDARVRLGRIVGASRMVFGGYFLLGGEVQVHVRVIDTATSRVLFSDEATLSSGDVMQQVQPMNRRLARALSVVGAGAGGAGGTGGTGGAEGTDPSFTTASWQSYDEALALADAGKLDDAVRALQTLLARDKTFTPAERQLVALLDKLSRR